MNINLTPRLRPCYIHRMQRQYRMTVGPDIAGFLPEIQYIQEVLRIAYGLEAANDGAPWLHYGAEAPEGAIPLPADFFQKCLISNENGLFLDRAATDAATPRLIPGTDPRKFDAFGLCFLLLSRVEERGFEATDRYGRYPYDADFMVRNRIYGRAPVDEALEAIASLILGRPAPPPLTRYRVLPTHDVDRLKAYHYPLEPLRYALGDLLKRGKPGAALRRLEAYRSDEPWRSVNDLTTLSENFGLTSRFYFIGPSFDTHDSPYAATMTGLLKEVADRLARRGHCLGFHPGYGTAENADAWQQQRAGLEQALGCRVQEGRQHMLCYQADTTPDIWDDAGMADDYTLAYPEVDGFRTGSCRRLPAYSLRHRKILTLRRTSTAIMEFGMFGGKYRALSVEQALEHCRPLIQTCRRFGGDLVVLYHTGQPRGAVREFYGRLLQEAA